jgi:hypothetical protein
VGRRRCNQDHYQYRWHHCCTPLLHTHRTHTGNQYQCNHPDKNNSDLNQSLGIVLHAYMGCQCSVQERSHSACHLCQMDSWKETDIFSAISNSFYNTSYPPHKKKIFHPIIHTQKIRAVCKWWYVCVMHDFLRSQ